LRIVLDTNVLVAALLSPFGAPARIVDAVLDGGIVVCYDTRILAEYREVLGRPKFGFDADAAEELLTFLESSGEFVTPPPVGAELRDVDDLMFLETALALKADFVVTGNPRHFPESERHGVELVSPAEFLSLLGRP
jgi:uncharacterized protein